MVGGWRQRLGDGDRVRGTETAAGGRRQRLGNGDRDRRSYGIILEIHIHVVYGQSSMHVVHRRY